MMLCFGEFLFEIKDGDFGVNMIGLYNYECYEGFLKGEFSFKFYVFNYKVNNFNIFIGVKVFVVRVKLVNILIC